jgi:GDP-D-mannose dehydratase
LRKGKNSNLKSNISKAKKTFGYKPKTDLDQLIKIMVDDCLKQKN